MNSCQVIHRDLKPRNLLVNSNCDLKVGTLADLGTAGTPPGSDHPGYLRVFIWWPWCNLPRIVDFPYWEWSELVVIVGTVYKDSIMCSLWRNQSKRGTTWGSHGCSFGTSKVDQSWNTLMGPREQSWFKHVHDASMLPVYLGIILSNSDGNELNFDYLLLQWWDSADDQISTVNILELTTWPAGKFVPIGKWNPQAENVHISRYMNVERPFLNSKLVVWTLQPHFLTAHSIPPKYFQGSCFIVAV